MNDAKAEMQEMIKRLSEAVRTGEVVAVAVATVHADGNGGLAFIANNQVARLHYALATLTHRVLMHEEPEL